MVNENELLRLLMLLSDTQTWLNEMSAQAVQALHPPAMKLMHGKSYRLPVTAFAHIIERHYYKTLRHPGTGKFTLPVPAILDLLKEMATVEAEPMKGNINSRRSLQLSYELGICKNGDPAFRITVITDPTGAIITAYPE